MNKTKLADVALKALLVLAFAWGAWETRKLRGVAEEANRHAGEANRHTAENNRMLKERDFPRLFNEHAQHHREHAEIIELLCSLPELAAKCEER